MRHQRDFYRKWVVDAIMKCRNAQNGRIKPSTEMENWFSYCQWAMADGLLHYDGQYLYQTKRTQSVEKCELIKYVRNEN